MEEKLERIRPSPIVGVRKPLEYFEADKRGSDLCVAE